MKTSLLFPLLFFLGHFFVFSQENFHLNHQSADDGLIQNVVLDIIEDDEGYRWLATGGGISRFDGLGYKNYDMADSLYSNFKADYLNKLVSDSDKRIWIATGNNGLWYLDKIDDRFKPLKSPLGQLFFGVTINDIYYDTLTSRLIVASNKGLGSVGPKGELTWITDTLKTEGAIVTSIAQLENGTLLAATQNDFLIRVENSTVEYLKLEGINDRINLIQTSNTANLLVGTDNKGLFSVDLTYLEARPLPNQRLSTGRVLASSRTQEGTIWVSMENQGVYILDGKSFEIVHQLIPNPDDPNSLSSGSIFSIFQDEEGRIWLGTFNKGFSYLDPYSNRFQLFRRKGKASGMSSDVVSAFLPTNNSKQLWIGTDGGGLNLWNRQNNSFKVFRAGDASGLTSDAILTIARNGAETWLGTWNGGLLLYENNRFLSYPQLKNKGYRPRHVESIHSLENGDMWLATFDNGLVYYDRKNNSIYKKVDLGPDQGMTVLVSKDGTIWYGSLKGLYKATPSLNDPTKYIMNRYQAGSNGLTGTAINTIFEDKLGQIWILTANAGLSKYLPETDRFKTYNTQTAGFPTNIILSMEEDNMGRYWIGSGKGLFSFDPRNEEVTTYEIEDGLQGLSYFKSSSAKLPGGELVFGGVNGFNLFNPSNLLKNPTPPKVHLEDFLLFNKSIDFRTSTVLDQPINYVDKISLNHNQSIFTLVYNGLNMSQAGKINYAYKMDGLEDNWNYVDQLKRVTYTNLDAGDYTFLVKAANNDGVWSKEPRALAITVLPPFWETWWFRAFAILVIVGAVYAWYKIRTKKLKKQKAHLEREVANRTADLITKQNEVNTQNEELMQQSEEILAQRDALEESTKKLSTTLDDVREKNEMIVDSIRYAETIQDAILPSPELREKLLGRHAIAYKPKDIVSGDFYWIAERGGYKFVAVLDCTGHGVPGAFMSMIGNTLLNRIIKEQAIYDPGKILTMLNAGIIESLRQETSQNSDGMDAIIARIEPDSKIGGAQVQYAGAKGTLYVSEGHNHYNTTVYKGDRKALGGMRHQHATYKTNTLMLDEGDILVLASDGIIDMQMKGGKRFGTPKFSELIEHSRGNMEKLQDLIEKSIKESLDNFKSRDDITVIGLKILSVTSKGFSNDPETFLSTETI